VIATFHFYAAWSAELAFLVAGTTVADYTFARLMDRTTNPRGRRALMLCSIGMNLGVLAYFKYMNFFLGSLNNLFASAGVPGSFDTLSILVPFGISLYTFEAISYAVDVYRRKIPAERSLPHFLLFILFFPHLVAGPPRPPRRVPTVSAALARRCPLSISFLPCPTPRFRSASLANPRANTIPP